MNFQLPERKRLFASMVIFILMVATLYSAILTTSYEPREIGGIFGGAFGIRIGDNVAVTDVPENNNEPSIAVDPNDPLHLVAAGNDYGTPDGDAWVGYYVSWDGGETWARDLISGYMGGPISVLTGFRGAGDPVVCFDGDGNVYISGIAFKRANNPLNPLGFGWNIARANGIFVAKSTDGGETFDQVRMVVSAMQSWITFHDKEWMAVDQHNGNVYVCWSVFTALMMSQLLLSRSTDGGQTWSRPMIITEFRSLELAIQGSTIQVDNEGTVHVAWIDFDSAKVRYSYSTDYGESFSTPESICDANEIPRDDLPNCDFRTPTLLMSAVDLSDTNTSGSLYITWNDYREGDADILLIYSRDKGATWSDPIRVNNDTVGNKKDQFFSAVAVSTQGYVHLIFYDRRDDEDNTLMQIYYAMSKNGGENFTIQTNVTSESFDGNNALGSQPFIGDYIGLAASNTTAYGIWCDTREGSPDSADCELYFVAVEFVCDECEHEKEE